MEPIDESRLESVYQRFQEGEINPISVLQDMQLEFGYVPEEAVEWFCRRSGVPKSRFFGIATFYSQFHLKPRGSNIVKICCGTVCHVKGAERINSRLKRELSLKPDDETTRDGLFTLEKVNCLGACNMAPVMTVNEKTYGGVTPGGAMRIMDKCKEEDSSE